MTVRDRIDHQMAELSRSEKRIARVIAERYPVSALGQIEEIARLAEVSAPTVTRFVRRLGFARFADFQRAIRLEVQDDEVSPLALLRRHRAGAAEGAGGPTDDARLFDSLTASIAALAAAPIVAALDRAAALLIANRARVWIMGGRWSSIAAQYLGFQMSSLRGEIHVLTHGASGVLEDRIADFTRRDLLILYDFRRYQADVATFAAAARRQATRIVLFTDPELSPVSDLAEVTIPVAVAITSPLDTLAPAIAASDALLARLVAPLGPGAARRMSELEAIRKGVQAPPTT